MKKKILLGVAIPTLIITGGASAFVISNDNKSDDKKSARTENVKKEEPKKLEEVSKPAEEVRQVTQAQSQTVQTQASEPIDNRPDWRKYLDNKLATDPNAPHIIRCMESYHGNSAKLPLTRAWKNLDDEARNIKVDATYMHTYFGLLRENPQEAANTYC